MEPKTEAITLLPGRVLAVLGHEAQGIHWRLSLTALPRAHERRRSSERRARALLVIHWVGHLVLSSGDLLEAYPGSAQGNGSLKQVVERLAVVVLGGESEISGQPLVIRASSRQNLYRRT
jgi:hypothetical protein